MDNTDISREENDQRPKKKSASGFSRYYFNTLLILTGLTFLFFWLSGYGYNWGIWGLSTAMAMLRITAYMMMIFGGIALFSLFFAVRSRQQGRHVSFTMMAVVMALITTSVALYWNHQVNNNPFIHDATTDTGNPPQFDAIVPLRADAPNPHEYQGEEVAERQREGFPDLITIVLPYPKERVYDEALSLIGARGWDLVAGNHETGIIEATHTLPWFGFKDDVVIRLRADNGRTVFDMRSKSRIGGTDLGVNANRIIDFTNDLKEQLRG